MPKVLANRKEHFSPTQSRMGIVRGLLGDEQPSEPSQGNRREGTLTL